MEGSRKTIGIILLAAVALAAGSVVCLASGQASAMADCGGSMSASLACPFMTVGFPSATAVSFGRVVFLISLVVLVFVALAIVLETDRCKSAALVQHRHSPEYPPASFLNSTLRLISQGILHPRVFGL